jgi:PAS domain S-box-containing protein
MSPTALLVDDEKSVQKLLKQILEGEGFAVSCASSIQESVELLSNDLFDLIIADIYLGNGSGIDLLRQIRALDGNAQVVLITGQPDVESASEAMRLGACDYLSKPLSLHQVIGVAHRARRSKILIDESVRKQANLDAIFHSTTDGIILIDRQGRVLQVNEAAMRSCGYSPTHLGNPILEIESGCNGSCRQTVVDVLNDGFPRSNRRLVCHNDGTRKTISFSASPVIGKDKSVDGVVAISRDETELVLLEKQVHRLRDFGGIVGASSAMQRMFTLVEALADVQTTVLINGESGTGKELVAAALHHQGVRSGKPFIKVNCSALSENLLESELFGHVRGAFTGAVTAKTGRFQKAHGGTIFLDEIGDISVAMQMRLLRVLQEQEFEPVGDSTPIKVNVRVIAATNQDLAEKVRLGLFRHDLYYRLNVVRLIIPPLRDRLDDIPLLVKHFLEKHSRKFQKTFTAVSPEVMEIFMQYDWPGNVRQLEHILEHAAILCRSSVISVENLPQDFINTIAAVQPVNVTDLFPERKMTIEEALVIAGGNKAKAARLLGVSRCTIYRKLEENPSSDATI